MNKEIRVIDVDTILANPHQPRQSFEEEKILELANSIEENGLIQPIVVRETSDGYELVAGERRLRALKYLKMEKVEAIVNEYDDEQSSKLAIIENIQREDLTPIEEAIAYDKLINEYNYTQNQLALSLGKAQSTIANKLRLLNLNDKVKDLVFTKQLNERQARALLSLEGEDQEIIAEKIVKDDLNVAASEKLVASKLNKEKKKKKKIIISKNDYRLEINTIKQALDMIESTGVSVEFEAIDLEDSYKIEILLKK
jgi:ParB family chromosome partitioning protein